MGKNKSGKKNKTKAELKERCAILAGRTKCKNSTVYNFPHSSANTALCFRSSKNDDRTRIENGRGKSFVVSLYHWIHKNSSIPSPFSLPPNIKPAFPLFLLFSWGSAVIKRGNMFEIFVLLNEWMDGNAVILHKIICGWQHQKPRKYFCCFRSFLFSEFWR